RIMKKLPHIVFVLIILLVSACSDFLDETPQGRYSSETFWKTQDHAELALVGLYEAAAFTKTTNALWVFGDMASDDAITGGNAGDFVDAGFIDQFTHLNTNT